MLLLPAIAFAAPHGPLCGTPERLRLHGGRPPAAVHVARAAGGACIDPQTLADQQGVDGEYTETLATDHVFLAWDPSNPVLDEAAVALYADAFDEAWAVEIDQLGWRAPDESDSCLMTVLLADFQDSWSGTGGWTDVSGSGGAPFMILNTDWQADGDEWVQTLVAHEFNHASQFGYDAFWDEADWWYWEATAEWMPDLVFDDANTYTWSLWSYFGAPWSALESTSGTQAYGHFVFNTFLEEEWGEDTPRAVWAGAADGGVADAVDAALAGEGSFRDALVGMTGHVAALDVDEADVWFGAQEEFDADPMLAHVRGYPASGDAGSTAPRAGGQNFVHFSGNGEGFHGDVHVGISAATEVDGVATDWAVIAARRGEDGVFTYEEVTLTDGAGEVTFSDLGAETADAWIAVTPLGAIDGGADWSWHATLEGGAEAEEPVACGCRGADGPAGLGGLVGVLAVARRRRRVVV